MADSIGDLNDDGIINSLDLTLLERYIAGLSVSTPLSDTELRRRADINGDGTINVLDITALERLIAESMVAEQTVELAPGESKTVSFEATPHEARTYQVSVDGLSGSFEATTAPPDQVTVALKNPPSGATMWSLSLMDWDMTTLIEFKGWDGKDRLDITEAATFEIPDGVEFPIKVCMLQLTKWNVDKTALIQVYYAQSMHANKYDWATGTYTGPPDPTYRDLFIPDYGSYYFNVATERFEIA